MNGWLLCTTENDDASFWRIYRWVAKVCAGRCYEHIGYRKPQTVIFDRPLRVLKKTKNKITL